MARAYSVTGRDCCAEGFERLRSQSEFILLASPGVDSTADSILAELVADLDSVMRPDGFDYEAAERALREWFAEGWPLREGERRVARCKELYAFSAEPRRNRYVAERKEESNNG